MNDKDLQLEQAPDFGKSKFQTLVVLLSTKYKLYDMVCFFVFVRAMISILNSIFSSIFIKRNFHVLFKK